MGDMSRCKHGGFCGYCMKCNEECPDCGGTGDDKEPDDCLCRRCKGLGLIDRVTPSKE